MRMMAVKHSEESYQASSDANDCPIIRHLNYPAAIFNFECVNYTNLCSEFVNYSAALFLLPSTLITSLFIVSGGGANFNSVCGGWVGVRESIMSIINDRSVESHV